MGAKTFQKRYLELEPGSQEDQDEKWEEAQKFLGLKYFPKENTNAFYMQYKQIKSVCNEFT